MYRKSVLKKNMFIYYLKGKKETYTMLLPKILMRSCMIMYDHEHYIMEKNIFDYCLKAFSPP